MMKLPAYPHLDGLVDLACRDGVDIRPTLIRVLTDLYVQKPAHSSEEETQYVELALGLLDTVDDATRAAVAASLAKYPAAPKAILNKLGSAQPAARVAPVKPPVVETADLTELFFTTGVHGRRQILANLEVDPASIARRPVPASSEVVRRLEAAALQHNTGEFGRVLERALGVSPHLAERIARDPSGEPVAIAAKAVGMTAAVLQRVLLFLNPEIGQSVERVHDLAMLFDSLAPEAAQHMVSVWRASDQKAGRTPRRVYEPLHYDDERRSVRPQPVSTARRSSSRDEQSTRNRGSGR